MNLVRSQLKLALLALAAALVGAGCSGINASHSVSPATFFLPGLMQYTPPPLPTNSWPLTVDAVAIVDPTP